MGAAPPLPLVAKALASAFATPPPAEALALALSWSIGEGAWASWKEGGADVYPFEGTNNFGSVHATRAFAEAYAQGGDLVVGTRRVSYASGWGMVAFLDHAPGAYVARMAVYPSLFAGAVAYAGLVSRFVNLQTTTSATEYAAQLYVHNYFEGFHPNRTILSRRAAAYQEGTWSDDDVANIADGASLLTAHLNQARAAIVAASAETGDPTDATAARSFAPLGVRLTPSQRWAPHTVDHARELLGRAADSPPAGAISLADALASPRGDGVWIFPEGVEVPAQPGPATAPAVVTRSQAEEIGAVLAGLALGTAAAVAVVAFRPSWIPDLSRVGA